MSGYEWLGRWEPLEAPGRHCRRYPAQFAHGYQYDPHRFRQSGVSRAIPVEGTVGPAWENSPQVRAWLEPERVPVLRRILEWLKK